MIVCHKSSIYIILLTIQQYIHTLYNFFADEEHLKRIIKLDKVPFGNDEIVSLELNCKYKESLKMLKHLVKFYPIKCYYA